MRLLGTVILAVQDLGSAVSSPETAPPSDLSIFSLVIHASPVVQFVLVTFQVAVPPLTTLFDVVCAPSQYC